MGEEKKEEGYYILATVTCIPVGTDSPSISKFVAESVKAIKETGVKHELTPNASLIYANDLDELFRAVKAAHEAQLKAGALRVSTTISIDDRRDKKRLGSDKIASVEEKLKG